MERAAVLLTHGMHGSNIPIAQLSHALARMVRTLEDGGAPLFGKTAAEQGADVEHLQAAFARDLAVCIESLQFHDRLMQQLAQARDILTGAALVSNESLAGSDDPPANEGSSQGSIELF
jgi:hypothetical protein